MLVPSQNRFGHSTRFCRVFPVKIALIAFIGCISFNGSVFAFAWRKPAPDITKIGHGIEVHLLSSKRGIRILREGSQIWEENMDDGLISLVLFTKASDDGKNYNIAVRFGTDADLYMAFAVIGDKVIKSPLFRNSASGDNDIPAAWTSPNRLAIGGKQPNAFDFDPTLNMWIQARPNSPPSKQGGISLGRVAAAIATGGASEVGRHAPDDVAKVLPVDPKKTAENLDKTLDKAAADTKREAPIVAKQIEKEAGKGIENFGDTLAKTIDDTPQTVADLGVALYDFAGKQAQYEGRQFTNFEKRVFEGKWADAVAHLGVDRFRNDEVNAAKAAQKSLILRTAGQIVATVYGGPYGAAAYAAWYTYNVTKDPALSIKAGLIAGLASAASSAASGAIGTETASQVTANAITNGAIAGVAAAASGGDNEDVLKAFVVAATSVAIQSSYKEITKHDLDPSPAKGEPYTKNTPQSYPDAGPNSPPDEAYFKNPDGILYLDAKGNPHVDVRLLDSSRPHTGLAAKMTDNGLLFETGLLMSGISKTVVVVNAMSVLHDVLGERWNLEGFVLKATIPPALVFTYYGTQAPTMELLLQDIQKKREADAEARSRP